MGTATVTTMNMAMATEWVMSASAIADAGVQCMPEYSRAHQSA